MFGNWGLDTECSISLLIYLTMERRLAAWVYCDGFYPIINKTKVKSMKYDELHRLTILAAIYQQPSIEILIATTTVKSSGQVWIKNWYIIFLSGVFGLVIHREPKHTDTRMWHYILHYTICPKNQTFNNYTKQKTTNYHLIHVVAFLFSVKASSGWTELICYLRHSYPIFPKPDTSRCDDACVG